MKGFMKIFIIALVAFSVAACSATPTRRSFNEYWKDQNMGTKVRYSMMKDKDVKFGHMKVNMWRGVATITGRAVSDYEKERAEQLAMSVKGVAGVNNYLEIVNQFSDKNQSADAKTAANTPAATTKSNDKAVAGTKVGKKGAPIKEEDLESTTQSPSKKPTQATSVAKDTAASKKSPVITVPSVDGATPSGKSTVARTTPTVEKKAPVAKPAASKSVVAEKKPATTSAASNVATASKPAQIMSQQEAAAWYKKINEVPAISTASSSDVATRKDVSQPTTVSIPATPALPPAAPAVQGPENDLAREAAEELRRLRTSSTPAN